MARRELLQMAEEINEHLSRVRQLLRKPLETEWARGGLTGPQRSVMQALVQSKGMSLKDLSRSMGLAHSTVSGIVDRLERRGLVERRSNDQDRRFSMIVASKMVRDYVHLKLPAITIHPLVEALKRAKAPERAAILTGVRALRKVVEGN